MASGNPPGPAGQVAGNAQVPAHIIKGMRRLPGRKSVVGLSEGSPYVSVGEGTEQRRLTRGRGRYRRLVISEPLLRRRLHVVLGGSPLGLTAADRPAGETIPWRPAPPRRWHRITTT